MKLASPFIRGVVLYVGVVVIAQLAACATQRATGDLGVIIERASGSVQIVEHSGNTSLGSVRDLGDLSHASLVYSRDERYAYVFGRDGGLTKIDMLGNKIVKRVMQSGNSIGGAISQDGRLVAVSNYEPGGVRNSSIAIRWRWWRIYRQWVRTVNYPRL